MGVPLRLCHLRPQEEHFTSGYEQTKGADVQIQTIHDPGTRVEADRSRRGQSHARRIASVSQQSCQSSAYRVRDIWERTYLHPPFGADGFLTFFGGMLLNLGYRKESFAATLKGLEAAGFDIVAPPIPEITFDKPPGDLSIKWV